MILPNKQDALHKAMLYRLLCGILDEPELARELYFKGGTAAAMLGWLNRFSLDLDFDLLPNTSKAQANKLLIKLFKQLNFQIKEKATNELFYVLIYQAPANQRQYLKLSVISEWIKSNQYQTLLLPEIHRYCQCQTKETMFANKLVALTDRFQKHGVIAGRDLYDIHSFLLANFEINWEVVRERTGKSRGGYLAQLTTFIGEKITQQAVDEDLNYLLPVAEFKAIRRTLVAETLFLLKSLEKSP
jgi:predicted nucleotidyltransferase component of viral defense system